jgi:hypothetical protein
MWELELTLAPYIAQFWKYCGTSGKNTADYQ